MLPLWNERYDSAILRGEKPLIYSAFCSRHLKWTKSLVKSVMRIERKPGEEMQVAWVGFELYCLWGSVTNERVEIRGKDQTQGKAILACALQVLIFFFALNLLRVELHDETMFKFWIFTQVIICCAPGLFWEQRRTRVGACWQLSIVIVLVAIMSFNPWNMWALICPQFFGVAANPWYYAMGAVTLFFALRGCWVYAKLPKKPDVLPDGKKPIF